MNETKYTLIPDRDVETLLDRTLPEMAVEIESLRLPGLCAVVLGGGYGRGEGGVLHTPGGGRLYNDLDFFVFSEGADSRAAARINRELKEISSRWEKKLGIAVDFGPVKNGSALKAVRHTLMYQELLRGWLPVWGQADLNAWIQPLAAAQLPYSEAVRLLLNRGMGLVLAGEYMKNGKTDPDFIVRNMYKSILGSGDALLMAAGRYCWRGRDRVAAFSDWSRREKLPPEYAGWYEKAFHWKLEPEPVLPSDPAGKWRECRDFYLEAVCRCAGAVPGAAKRSVIAGLHRRTAKERSWKNGLRWLLRARSLRSPGAAFDPPVVSVLSLLYSELAGKEGYADLPAPLYQLWKVFH